MYGPAGCCKLDDGLMVIGSGIQEQAGAQWANSSLLVYSMFEDKVMQEWRHMFLSDSEKPDLA
uniref:Uncharacterized protein n=1 Tax=Oryza rufipogon TaxID=4529 RepID=A0A0E0PTW8_ORYRU